MICYLVQPSLITISRYMGTKRVSKKLPKLLFHKFHDLPKDLHNSPIPTNYENNLDSIPRYFSGKDNKQTLWWSKNEIFFKYSKIQGNPKFLYILNMFVKFLFPLKSKIFKSKQ